MQPAVRSRSIGYALLCASPFLIVPLVGARPLHIAGLREIVGIVLCGSVAVCAWLVARPAAGTPWAHESLARAGGASFLTPFALVALLWIGLGTPWDATPVENRMRYAVLLAASIAVTVGFVLAREALRDTPDRLFSTLCFAAGLLSGVAYLVWTGFYLGVFAAKVTLGKLPPGIADLANILDVLLFVGSALAYLATAALAHGLAQAGWLGRRAALAYVSFSALALALLLLRGLAFPDPTHSSTPWYARPGFVAGVPAVPWLMPYLLGIVLLRRAGGQAIPAGPASVPGAQSR